VDDGSADATANIARDAGVATVRLERNSGVGNAVRTGLGYAEEHGYARAVVVDADGQHDPSGITALLEELDAGYDIVVGSRFAAESSSYDVGWIRRLAMRSLAHVVRRVTGRSFSDVTSGYRAFDALAIEVMARRHPAEYLADTVGSLLVAYGEGLRIEEIAVRMRPRAAGKPSARHVHLVRSYVRLLWNVRRRAYDPEPQRTAR